jgi:hypothetical protein
MASNEEIYSIDFDPTKFIGGIEQGLLALSKMEKGSAEFEAALKKLQGTVNGVSFNKPIASLTELQSRVRQGLGQLDLKGINASIEEFTKDTEGMKKLLVELKKQLKITTDPAEFKKLREGIKMVEDGLQDMGVELENTDNKGFTPLKKRLKELKVSLQEMEEAGLDGTQMYRDMEMEAAKLTDTIADQQKSIKTLASDTLALDTGIQAIQGLTAAFQVYEGALAAVGVENDNLQATMNKLMGLMNLANGLQVIGNLLQKESAVRKAFDNGVTLVKNVITRVQAKTTEEAAAAQLALNLAMKENPIGLVITALVALAGALYLFMGNSKNAEKEIKDFNLALEEQDRALQKNLQTIEYTTNRQLAAAKKRGASQEELDNITNKGIANKAVEINQQILTLEKDFAAKQKTLKYKNKEERLAAEKEFNDKILDLENQGRQARNEYSIAFDNAEADRAQAWRDNQLKLAQDLRASASDLANIQGAVNGETPEEIKARYARQLEIEVAAINEQYKLLGDKKQIAIKNQIIANRKATSKIQLEEDLKGFNETTNAARKDIKRAIEDKYNEIARDTIGGVKDQYEQVAQAITQQEKEQVLALGRGKEDFAKSQKDLIKNAVISPEEAAQNIADYNAAIEQQLGVIRQGYNKARIDNNLAYLQSVSDTIKLYGDSEVASITEKEAQLILIEAERYKKGEISEEKYQDNILNIQKKAKKLELEQEIITNEKLLASLEDRYAKTQNLTDKLILETQIKATKAAISGAKTALDTMDSQFKGVDNMLAKIFGVDPSDANGQKKLTALKTSIGDAVSSVASLLQAQNQAELAQLDSSIDIQQKRVDAALSIAAQGNAEYLQQEEERLKQLEQQREAAANKQLAINAVLQASEIALSVASGIAQGIKIGGPVGVAINIATIVAGLASVAGLISSLNSSVPKLASGTDFARRDMRGGADFVNRGQFSSGKDTIPAWLDEGEAVISKDKNSLYHPTIKAIRRGLIPSGVMNSFVENFSNGVNYNKIGKTARDNSPHFMEMNQRLGRLEGFMSETAQAIKGLAVNVNMDSDGFAASINTHLNTRKRILNA